ncbi:hypothetical protein J416_03746 [Gracilibacillus halophilus YIM-C55.5]|uniref:Uncharacterized protein n=1 Tax=Gracilibacillus halophilus YIM-C55.5 TaxID=1308866 RepID=N4WTT4_9BACI|nr:DUF1450 domain-containing protein [Gracilibacillus halophilus]ENH97770.1 hypothetical protein J416_03746 [Gracilibacillus halophilus YIM-C55.5]
MFSITIDFCVTNLANGSHQAQKQLETDPDLEVVEHQCLRLCGICRLQHVAVVNGKPITASTPDELVEQVYEYIDEELIHEL